MAELASSIEIGACGEKIGKQDQYAATFGGLNFMTFDSDGVEVTPLHVSNNVKRELSHNLLCFFTGQTRSASTILDEQVSKLETGDKNTTFFTRELVDLAYTGKRLLQNGRLNEFGEMLDHGWSLKKSMSSGITNPLIEQMYADAKKAGALGGKILGAGGGGYLLVYVPPKFQSKVFDKLKAFSPFVFDFTDEGSRVVFNDESA